MLQPSLTLRFYYSVSSFQPETRRLVRSPDSGDLRTVGFWVKTWTLGFGRDAYLYFLRALCMFLIPLFFSLWLSIFPACYLLFDSDLVRHPFCGVVYYLVDHVITRRMSLLFPSILLPRGIVLHTFLPFNILEY